MFLRVFLLVCLSLVSSCGSSGESSAVLVRAGDVETSATISTQAFEVHAGSDGRSEISFNVPAGTSKFAITAEVPLGRIRFSSIESDIVSVSLANRFFNDLVTASVPSRSFDRSLVDFQEYTAQAVATSPLQEIVFHIYSSSDQDLNSGKLRVNIFRVGNLATSDEISPVIESALEVTKSIYKSQAGIELITNFFNTDGPSVLTDPGLGSEFYMNHASSVPMPAVNVFIGNFVEQGPLTSSILGLAPGIPGPPMPSPRSAVAVSLLISAGPDGDFSKDDTRILGQTIAHEIGHYLGLYHPVEISTSKVSVEDPLSDTATCELFTQCMFETDLPHNLMFPTPVADYEKGGTIPQDTLTPQQRGVLNRYISVF